MLMKIATCPYCSHRIRMRDTSVGRSFACPRCGESLRFESRGPWIGYLSFFVCAPLVYFLRGRLDWVALLETFVLGSILIALHTIVVPPKLEPDSTVDMHR